jgi:hypothetical protein
MKSRVSLIFCALFLLISTFFAHRWNSKNNAVISYDAAGYYLYLPSVFYDDLGKQNNKDYIVDKYNPFGCSFDDANKKANGNYILKYTCGVAILEFPAFAVAHFFSKIFHFPTDGFSLPYQICINFWSIFFGIFGLWILRKTLLNYFSDSAVAGTLFILCIASNLYNFIAFSGNMSHSYLFTLYALLLFYTDSFYKNPAAFKSILLGIVAGFIVLIRPTEIICIVIVIAWNISTKEDVKNRFLFFRQHFTKLLYFAIAAVFIGSIQLVYWKIYSGHWLFWSYGEDESFNFLKPHLLNWLISYKKGWLTYTPVMILSLIGFWNLYKTNKQLFIACFLFTILNIYLCSAWNCWWYGGSFSQRSVVQSYAILAFPLTAFFQTAFSKRIILYVSSGFVVFCAWLNLLMTYQAYSDKGIMENELMSKQYFWKIFGKTNIQKSDKKFIDLQDEMPSDLNKKMTLIYSNDFESDSSLVISQASSGKRSIVLNKEKQVSNEIYISILPTQKGYYRAVVKAYPNEKEWNSWMQTQWIIGLYCKNKEVKTNFYRVHRIIEPGSWQEISIDIKTLKNEPSDQLRIKFWNANSEKQIQFDDLKVYFAPY